MNVFKIIRGQRFYIKFSSTLIALCGLWGGIISFSPISLNYIGFLISSILILFISFVVGVFNIHKEPFPTDDVVPYDLSDIKSKIVFPCTLEQYKYANMLANDEYDKKDNINFEIIKQWRQKNNLILSLYYDKTNKLMGYFDVLPLTKEFEEKLRDGILTEQDINYDSILSPSEMCYAEVIYIGGVAVRDINRACRSYHGGLILSALLTYLKTFYSFNHTVIMSATAASVCGENLLKRLGFTIYREGAFRKDKHDYYMKEVTIKDIRKWENEFGKYIYKVDKSAYNQYIESTE